MKSMLVALLLLASCNDGDSDQVVAQKRKTELTTLKKYAFEAYPEWAVSQPAKECPDSLADLDKFMNGAASTDLWGHAVHLFCGKNLPPTVRGLGVSSDGPDGKPNTPDDLHSWD